MARRGICGGVCAWAALPIRYPHIIIRCIRTAHLTTGRGVGGGWRGTESRFVAQSDDQVGRGALDQRAHAPYVHTNTAQRQPFL